ncbi:MAG: GxxExxY protein [Chloroflexi bacterium]|nr:GxxExxY protein [Chloroflexota bacterium]MBP8058331.1 GxxExxY protein [Chloroflexota bacterium]
MVRKDELNQLTEKIIGAAIEVHRHLGPGLLESTYESCLVYELEQLGLIIEKQKPLPVVYKGLHIEQGYRLDLLVNEVAIVELKAVEVITPVHEAQILSYLKLSGCPVGLLLNFNVKLLKNGIKRYLTIK